MSTSGGLDPRKGVAVAAAPVVLPYYADETDPEFTTVPFTGIQLSNSFLYTAQGAFVDVVLGITCIVTTDATPGNRFVAIILQTQDLQRIALEATDNAQAPSTTWSYSFAYTNASALNAGLIATAPLPLFPMVAGTRWQVTIQGAAAGDRFSDGPFFSVVRYPTREIRTEEAPLISSPLFS